MEIEKKFLLYERGKNFSNKKYFPHIRLTKLKVRLFGKKIIQTYIKLKHLEKVIEISKINLDFKPTEIRIRKYGKEYYLTIKSRQKKFQRKEFEVRISHKVYTKLYKLKDIELRKIRYSKKIEGLIVEFDYYKKLNLLTCEAEVNSKKNLEKIPQLGKLATGIKKYKNSQLAKHFN